MSSTPHKQREREILGKYIPACSIDYVLNLFYTFPVKFKIVSGRKTKLGDFRPAHNGHPNRITVNGDLNPYSFLITTVHEFAHLTTFLKFGNKISPHGEEWKKEYRILLLPLIDQKMVPQDIENALINSLVNTKASSCTDIKLSRVLLRYDTEAELMTTLEKLQENSIFTLQGRKFKKGPLARSRFLCEEIHSRKKYHVHCLAVVEHIDEI